MNFNIGDKVKDKDTNQTGVITDKMFSEGKGCFLYIIKPSEGGRSFMRKEDELDPCKTGKEYKVETQIADNVVIGIIYEVVDGQETEMCRGHAHIIHEGVEGIAQACSYAYKRAFSQVDSGIYMKQRKETDGRRTFKRFFGDR